VCLQLGQVVGIFAFTYIFVDFNSSKVKKAFILVCAKDLHEINTVKET